MLKSQLWEFLNKGSLANRLLLLGLVIILLGWGPLLGFLLMDSLGFISDPNPNPIGLGLLFFFSFWPAITCLAIGGCLKIVELVRAASRT